MADGVVFEPVGVSLRIPITFIPTCLAIVGDSQRSAVLEWDGDWEVCEELWDDCVFV